MDKDDDFIIELFNVFENLIKTIPDLYLEKYYFNKIWSWAYGINNDII